MEMILLLGFPPPAPLPLPPPFLQQEGNLFSLGELEGGGQPCSYRKY